MINVPGTTDNWIDESALSVPVVEDKAVRPLFLTAFTSDRGPVGLRRVAGQEFYKLYGQYCNFEKHGQPLIQAAHIINNGGELLCTRVVSPDATIANLTITATVKVVKTQKTDQSGQLLYIDADTGQETTATTASGDKVNDPAMINTAKIKYDAVTTSDAKSYNDIVSHLEGIIVEDEANSTYTYPIFTVLDNGVGSSTKRFKISPNYNLSRSVGFVVYQFIYAGTQSFDYEYINFSTIPDKIYNSQSMSLDMATKSMVQLAGYEYRSGIVKLYDRISEITGIQMSELETYDLLMGKNIKGGSLSAVVIDLDGYSLNSDIGFALLSGTDGLLGSHPIKSEKYDAEIVKVFNGDMTDDIYDLDRYQIDACVDACYSIPVKKAISDLAAFRKDFYFFADLGLGADSYDQIATIMEKCTRSKFVSYYYETGQIVDPFSKKYITVTLMYGLAAKLINHLLIRPEAPVTGILYDFTFPEFIEGTINFLPKITPKFNQKSMLQEIGVNYASILNNVLTLETEFTSQKEYSQLSFINNVTSIQQVIKAIRRACPAFRYSFVTTDDLDQYRSEVSNIVKQYKDNFDTLEVVYVQDELMKLNKIFEASLRFKHKDFYQAEVINVYTLGIGSV